mmetsp:Transcript_18109/g.31746  ORF Transcript_18109/g.31746 Transcript_18109/m.31746 type:complete len:173 (-) Transcript_18109:30-548(-)
MACTSDAAVAQLITVDSDDESKAVSAAGTRKAVQEPAIADSETEIESCEDQEPLLSQPALVEVLPTQDLAPARSTSIEVLATQEELVTPQRCRGEASLSAPATVVKSALHARSLVTPEKQVAEGMSPATASLKKPRWLVSSRWITDASELWVDEARSSKRPRLRHSEQPPRS